MSVQDSEVWARAWAILNTVDISPEALRQRFHGLGHPAGINLTTVSARKKKNQNANRYSNVLPYDHNCIKVRSPESGKRGKYINASLIKAGEKEISSWSYVGAQGPLKETIADFWRMIVQQECRAVVMLTRCTERSENKCAQYFPQRRGEEMKVQGVRVKCELNQFLGGTSIEQRALSISVDESEPYICTHYRMLCWPDHGAPKETETVRDIIRAVQEELARTNGIACIHCSAGVGRTGTYITIDAIISRLATLSRIGGDESDIQAALDVDQLIYYLRSQRMGLVQSVEQYLFIFTALIDFVREELEAPSGFSLR